MNYLPWLLPAPEDFNDQCANITKSEGNLSTALDLAQKSLSLNQSARLAKTLERNNFEQHESSKTLTPFRLGIVSNGTFDLFAPAIKIAALRHEIILEIVQADFDQAVQESLNPDSLINSAGVDAVLIALDYRGYPFASNTLACSTKGTTAADAIDYLNQLRAGFAKHCGVPCLVQSLACPPFSLLGGLDAQLDGLLRKEINDFNYKLSESLRDSSDILLDISALANTTGTCNWFDERQWLMSRIPIANELVPLYSDHVARTIAALRGKSKKCLVLDLDNTLWAGVIGDDGLEGIKVEHGHPLGEAHLAIQQYALELKNHGIILAVCSKNEESNALLPFRNISDMVLKEDDFAIFVANWNDKASNIQHIASTLNIGLDSIVFVDDNPMERDVVRTLLPTVTVPELPEDATLIPRTLAAAGFFDLVSFTPDDLQRNSQYQENAVRAKSMGSANNLEEYLASLEMTIEFKPFDNLGRKRITQLVNKTNQFNLTTQRYTEAEIEIFESDQDFFTRQVRLSDKFGDNGMISVLIAKREDDCLAVDSWLMSCRVIKRRVEDAICDELVGYAKQEGIKTIRGFYRPTPKNALVKDHYEYLGFTMLEHTDDRVTWELQVNNYKPLAPPMRMTKDFIELSEG